MDKKYDNIQTIYDLVVFAYTQIVGSKEEYYLEKFLNEDLKWKIPITQLLKELIYGNYTIEEFLENLKLYLYDEQKLVWIHILIEFDKYYSERDKYPLLQSDFLKKLIKFPIKNNISDEWGFYPLFQENFILKSDIMSSVRNHRIRKGIWDYIKSYRINRIDKLEEVSIIQYQNDFIKKLIEEINCLKIAIIPFSNVNRFEENKETGVRELKKYSNDEIKQIFENYKILLEKLDTKGVNIVILPELVMEKEIIDNIKKWLTSKVIEKSNSNIKLLFIGSYSEDSINQCLLLSGTGKEILRNSKRNGFSYTDKKGNSHREALGDFSNEINLADIIGLGRVWYLICKDALLHEKNTILTSEYGINVQMISAYSSSISDFKKIGISQAEQYSLLTVVSNACAARTEKTQTKEIGVVCYPMFDAVKKDIHGWYSSYECEKNMEKGCYCNCAFIFQFNIGKEMEAERKEIMKEKITSYKLKGVEIEYEQLMDFTCKTF